jgi:hypothetical protein
MTVVDGVNTFQLDPAVLARTASMGTPLSPPPYKTSLVVVNAALKCEVPAVSMPHPDLMKRAASRWEELGLPPISPRRRIMGSLNLDRVNDAWHKML